MVLSIRNVDLIWKQVSLGGLDYVQKAINLYNENHGAAWRSRTVPVLSRLVMSRNGRIMLNNGFICSFVAWECRDWANNRTQGMSQWKNKLSTFRYCRVTKETLENMSNQNQKRKLALEGPRGIPYLLISTYVCINTNCHDKLENYYHSQISKMSLPNTLADS